ncbi:MAG: mechanosensitive ion channel family protein [Chloroflexi bacterium]|nr:mechanosensitive ion channel family protein [Chloroflexota bacterium]
MVRDFILEFTNNEDITTVIMRGLLPVATLILTFVLRRLIPAILRRIVRSMGRLARMTGLGEDLLREEMVEVFVPPLRFFITITGLRLIVLLYEVRGDLQIRVNTVYTTLVLIAVFWAIYRVVNRSFIIWYNRAHQRTERDAAFNETIVQFLARVAETTVFITAVVVILQQWGVNLTALLAGLGLGGLAVALAAQETLSNLVGYFSIILDRPFDVGDYIISGDFEGVVEEIGFRATRIRRSDRAIIHVPNAILASQVVTNWSQNLNGPRRGRTRLHITVGVTYSTNADQMEFFVNALRQMLEANQRVVQTSVVVNFVEFGDSSLDIMLVCLVRVSSWEEIQQAKHEINIAIMRLLAEQGLEIAFPTRTIVLEQTEVDD